MAKKIVPGCKKPLSAHRQTIPSGGHEKLAEKKQYPIKNKKIDESSREIQDNGPRPVISQKKLIVGSKVLIGWVSSVKTSKNVISSPVNGNQKEVGARGEGQQITGRSGSSVKWLLDR